MSITLFFLGEYGYFFKKTKGTPLSFTQSSLLNQKFLDKSFEFFITTNGNENRSESCKNELLFDWVIDESIKKEEFQDEPTPSKVLEVLSFGEIALSFLSFQN